MLDPFEFVQQSVNDRGTVPNVSINTDTSYYISPKLGYKHFRNLVSQDMPFDDPKGVLAHVVTTSGCRRRPSAPYFDIKINPLGCHQLTNCFPKETIKLLPTFVNEHELRTALPHVGVVEEGIYPEAIRQVRVDQVMRLDVVDREDAYNDLSKAQGDIAKVV